MHCTVRYHAILQERLGKQEDSIPITADLTAALLLEQIGQQYPALQPLIPSLKIAINDEFVEPHNRVREGDRVDLLPPFGGG